jgi:hypothetical protein
MGWTRRLVGLAASLAGLAAGTVIGGDDVKAEDEGRETASSLESAGTSASGPSFYVWEEDREQARRWAAELERSPPLKDDYFG